MKVVFKGTYGPIIKDLEDILAKQKDSPSYRHQTATDIIASLRESRIKELDDLLTVLVPRHTSWPRDVAIISGLLVGVDISSEASQQKIYQNILNKIGKVSHGHLFHNTATMSNGYCWCSTSLLTLPLASTNSSQVKSVEAHLCVEKEGDIVGLWRVFELGDLQESIFIWKGTHRFLAATLRLALKDKKNHLLLIEPKPGPIRRAILVKVMTKRGENPEEVRCHFVGSVYFHSPQFTKEIRKNLKVRIGNTEGMKGVDGNALEKLAGWSKRIKSEPREEREKEAQPQRADDHRSALITAAENCDEKEVKRLLQENTQPNRTDYYGRTALHRAIWKGYNNVVTSLIEDGNADATIRDKLGQQAIHLAAERGNEIIFDILVKHIHSSIEHIDSSICKDRQSVLHRAAWGGSRHIVKKLLQKKAKAILQDQSGRTALHIAAEKGHKEVVELLLKEAGADIPDNNGRTALHIAAEKGYVEVVELLLNESGPDIPDNNGKTALHIAAEKGYMEVVELLLKGTNANIRDNNGNTALHIAAEKGYIEVVKLLLKETGADIPDNNGKTALHIAAGKGYIEVVELQLGKGANVNAKGEKFEHSALTAAAAQGYLGVVEQLLKAMADVNAKQYYEGRAALQAAAGGGHLNVVERLLTAKADPNAAGAQDSGRTALQAAAEGGYLEIVELLIETANVKPMTQYIGGAALLAAAGRGHLEVVERLLAPKVNVNTIEGDHYSRVSVLAAAARAGHLEVVEQLLAAKADVHARVSDYGKTLNYDGAKRRYKFDTYYRTYEGTTALQEAARGGHLEVVERLLEAKTDVNADADNQRQISMHWLLEPEEDRFTFRCTALQMAAGGGHLEVVERLLAAKADVDTYGALQEASRGGHLQVVERLLEATADVNEEDMYGDTALQMATLNDHLKVMERLLKAKADVNVEAD